MNPFAFSLHHSFHEYEQSKIESYFSSLKSKIAMHERHIEVTVKLYQKEKDDAVEKLNIFFKEPLKKANLEYERLLEEYGNDINGQQVAGHESRLDNIADEHSRRDYDISEEFAEMSQNFHNMALIQAHSFFEKEISDLCNILKGEFNQLISADDFNSRDYLQGSLKYLELVIGLDMQKLESFTNKFRDIQYLRNRITHERGEFQKNSTDPDHSLKKIKSIVTASKKRISLEEETDVYLIRITNISYILEHYQVIRDFFQGVINLLELKSNYKIIKSRIQYVFSSLAAKPVVKVDKVEYTARSFEIRFTIKFPKSTGLLRKVKARLTIKKFKTSPLHIDYVGTQNKEITGFVNNLKSINHVLLDMMWGYLITCNRVQSALYLSEVKRV